jgi:hypothetical protein
MAGNVSACHLGDPGVLARESWTGTDQGIDGGPPKRWRRTRREQAIRVEIDAVETIAPVQKKELLIYVKLTDKPRGVADITRTMDSKNNFAKAKAANRGPTQPTKARSKLPRTATFPLTRADEIFISAGGREPILLTRTPSPF